MKDEILGVKVLPFTAGDHKPGTVEVSEPHRLTGFNDQPTRLRYVSIVGYDANTQPSRVCQIPELPGKLGSAATNLMTELFIRTTAVHV